MIKLTLKYFAIIALLAITHDLFSQTFWQPTNGPQGGNYRRLKTNKANGYTYLLTYWNTNHGNGTGGNLFKSNDGGMNWSEIDNGLDAQGIWDIAYSSINTDLVIATSPSSPTLSSQSIIYYSSDNGGTWAIKSTTTFNGINEAVGITYNATSDTIFSGKKLAGAVYSFTSGGGWVSCNTGLTNLNTSDLEYGYQGKLYLSTDSVSPSNGAKVFVKNGTSWTNVSAGLTNTRINDLYYHASTSTMYLGTANVSAGSGAIYKSINGGTWTQVPGYTGSQVIKIITASNGDLLVSALNQGVWRLSLGVWTAVNTNLPTLNTSTIANDTAGNVFLTTKAGIWKFNSSSNDWSYFTNGIKNSQGRSMAFAQNGDLVVGTDNGMYHSPDGGNTWSHAGLSDNPMMSTILYSPDGRMFSGNTNGTASHIYISPDNGLTWALNETGFVSLRSADMAVNSAGKIFVGTGWSSPVHSSLDGINWNGPGWSTLGFGSSTLSLAIAIDSSDNIFTGMEDDGVWRSINNGSTYQYVGLALASSNVSDIKISPNQDIFVSQTPFTGGATSSLFRSTDGGNTWSANLMATANGLTNCIFIASDDSIYVGSSQGVWFSADTGSTWSLLNTGLNTGNIVIHTLELGPDGYLYAGTAGAGIYRSVNKIKNTITTVDISNSPENKTDVILYPNPANTEVSFSKTLNDIEVFNVYGQLVIPKLKTAKAISVQNLKDGVYFIKTNNAVLKFAVKH